MTVLFRWMSVGVLAWAWTVQGQEPRLIHEAGQTEALRGFKLKRADNKVVAQMGLQPDGAQPMGFGTGTFWVERGAEPERGLFVAATGDSDEWLFWRVAPMEGFSARVNDRYIVEFEYKVSHRAEAEFWCTVESGKAKPELGMEGHVIRAITNRFNHVVIKVALPPCESWRAGRAEISGFAEDVTFFVAIAMDNSPEGEMTGFRNLRVLHSTE